MQVSSATVRSEMVALERDGLSGAAPHQRRAHPDGQGLPLLRRPPDRARASSARPSARRSPTSSTRSTARWRRARAGHGPAAELTSLRRGRGRPVARRPPPSAPSSWSASRRSTRCWSSCSPTAPSRSGPSTSTPRSSDEALAAPAAAPRGAPGGAHAQPAPGAIAAERVDREVDQLVAPALDGPRRRSGRDARPTRSSSGGPARLAESLRGRRDRALGARHPRAAARRRDAAARRPRPGLSVAIGTEHGYEPLSSCAVVVAPVSVDGQDLGAVGLLGPTRMDYPRAMAAAHVVGERLGERHRAGVEGTMAVTDGLGDLYELLGVRPRRQRRGDQAGLPGHGPASCTPTRTRATPRPRRASSR